jgi:eukaryotic-like serine/threonine-protein kinase
VPPFSGDAEALVRAHQSDPVPLGPVPAPLRPLVAAGMAKDPARRPVDAMVLAGALGAAAAGAYGPDWEERGRSRLGEAAVALAALWPLAAPPAAQGFTVHRVFLGRPLTPLRAVIVLGAVVAVAAIGTVTAVAATSHDTPAPPAAHAAPPTHSVSLAPPAATTAPPALTPSPSVTPTPPAIVPPPLSPTTLPPATSPPASKAPKPTPKPKPTKPKPTPTPTPTTSSPSPTPTPSPPPITVSIPTGRG